MTISINPAGLEDYAAYLGAWPTQTADAMSKALNFGAQEAVKALRVELLAQINFPPGYLELPDRLEQSKYSTPTQLEARVSGRGRGTSLARFVVGGATVGGKGGVTIEEKPGTFSFFKQGFLVNLNSGNIGFAIRVRPGEQVHGVQRYQPIELFHNKAGQVTAYLLYGVSVDQAMGDASDKVTPEITSAIRDEFLRLLELSKGVTKYG